MTETLAQSPDDHVKSEVFVWLPLSGVYEASPTTQVHFSCENLFLTIQEHTLLTSLFFSWDEEREREGVEFLKATETKLSLWQWHQRRWLLLCWEKRCVWSALLEILECGNEFIVTRLCRWLSSIGTEQWRGLSDSQTSNDLYTRCRGFNSQQDTDTFNMLLIHRFPIVIGLEIPYHYPSWFFRPILVKRWGIILTTWAFHLHIMLLVYTNVYSHSSFPKYPK